MGKILPQVGILHHLTLTGLVVLLNGNRFSDILLGDAKQFLNAKFYGQTVGVPASLTVHLKALLGFISTKDILNGPGHHVMNTWNTIGRWRPLVKNVGWLPLANG